MSFEDKYIEIKKIEDEIRRCKKCSLYKTRTKPVPGEGSIEPKIFFIGEAPGVQEDRTGRPFVGAAGKLLTSLIEDIGLSREDVYITNVIKCRPPGNRDPREDEIRMCKPYLERQLMIIRPKIIVTLGRYAASVISEYAGKSFRSMSREHGIKHDVYILGFNAKLLHTYHPAAALYNPKLLESLKNDFATIKDLLEKPMKKKGTLEDFL